MTVQKLINQYNAKIKAKDEVIKKLKDMIAEARRNKDLSSDLEDLQEEKNNASHDRQIYFQFTKDLEDLL